MEAILSLCIFVLVVSLCFLLLDLNNCSILLSRFAFRRRWKSPTLTPLRALGPEKQVDDGAAPVEPDYKDVLPPLRREALAEIYHELPASFQQSTLEDLIKPPPLGHTQVPLATPAVELSGQEYTPTGFSIAEIRQLGDFPDYASLSGVPLPIPYEHFDIKRALPRPYRPLRWAYHQTMSLSKLEPDYWLELENTYTQRITQRRAIYAQYGKLILQALPGSDMACKELMEMVVQFLCARYPHYFTLDREKLILHNKILDTKTPLRETHPLHVLLEHVPEDFAIMMRNPENGFYTCRAGVICSAIGWDLNEKIGKRLYEIHEPVPEYHEKMRFSMDRYFAKQPTEKPIQRGAWGFAIDQPLFVPATSTDASLRHTQDPTLSLPRLHFRVDWQTLRRLPLSGVVVFNFKALFTPLETLRDEPYIPALCLKVLEEGKKSLIDSKDTWHVEHVLKPALREWSREQIGKGMVEEGWEVETLKEAPWFPGWEEKWRREQGF